MKKTFNFGKVDYLGHGRRDCAVTVTVELHNTDKGAEFSASGEIWNAKHTYIYYGGQCLDTIAEYVKSAKFAEILRLWKSYHLNGMHAGTQEQEQAIDEALKNGTLARYDYKEVCNYLQSIGLYEVMNEGKPYKYGHGWIFYPIPENDLAKITALLT